jgi:S1-C subfamily serine protease
MIAVRSVVPAALAALAFFPAGAMAQERQPVSRPRVYINGDTVMRDRIRLVTQRRARLGVTVKVVANPNDSIGASIESVTPGGPAAKAGLKSGDIITRINGKSLTASDGTKLSEDDSPPGLRLIETASQLKPNDNVSIEYLRGDARRSTTLVAGDEPILAFEGPDFSFGTGGRIEDFPRMRIEQMMPRSQGGRGGVMAGPNTGGFTFAFGGPFMDLELAQLNSDLGQYFGATDGVLVIDVPRESELGLKGGDVVQSIDGRKVTSPASLFRILRSYDPGDSFKLEIMRNKSHMTVTGKLQKERD